MVDLESLLVELERGRDRATLDVLADALVEQGDPRGELIHVQRGMADGAEVGMLRARELALVAQLRERLLGELAAKPEIETTYVDGFLDRVAVVESPEPYSMGDTLARIVRSTDARFLRAIAIDPTEQAETDRPIATVLERLAGVAMPSTLASLELGTAFGRNGGYRIFNDLGRCSFEDDLTALLDVFPGLAELRVDLGAALLAWAPLRSETLRRFAFVAPHLFREELDVLAGSELPALQSFELWTGGAYIVNDESDLYVPAEYDEEFDEDGEPVDRFEVYEAADVERLEPVFAMLDRTNVTALAIVNYAHDVGAVIDAIAAHPFAARLTRLDVSRATSLRGVPAAIARLPALSELVLGHVALARSHFGRLPDVVAALADRELEQYRYVVTQE